MLFNMIWRLVQVSDAFVACVPLRGPLLLNHHTGLLACAYNTNDGTHGLVMHIPCAHVVLISLAPRVDILCVPAAEAQLIVKEASKRHQAAAKVSSMLSCVTLVMFNMSEHPSPAAVAVAIALSCDTLVCIRPPL